MFAPGHTGYNNKYDCIDVYLLTPDAKQTPCLLSTPTSCHCSLHSYR